MNMVSSIKFRRVCRGVELIIFLSVFISEFAGIFDDNDSISHTAITSSDQYLYMHLVTYRMDTWMDQ